MTIKEAFQLLANKIGSGMKNPFIIARNLHDACATIAEDIEDGGGNKFVSVTADGTKTYAQLLNELYALVDFTKISKIISIYDEANSRVLPVNSFSAAEVDGSGFRIVLSNITMYCIMLTAATSTYRTATVATNGTVSITTISSTVPAEGKQIILYYL